MTNPYIDPEEQRAWQTGYDCFIAGSTPARASFTKLYTDLPPALRTIAYDGWTSAIVDFSRRSVRTED
jgi:hypothetical protein